MKKNAFSLVELIFVIVLIGVLAGIGFYYSRPDYTRQDAQYTLLKLKEARYRAIGYETIDGSCSENGWVQLTIGTLSLNETPKHEIKSNNIDFNTSILTDINKTICFDSLGRPHDGNNTTLSTLIRNNFNITFSSNSGEETNITLYSGTGYAIIPCNN